MKHEDFKTLAREMYHADTVYETSPCAVFVSKRGFVVSVDIADNAALERIPDLEVVKALEAASHSAGKPVGPCA